MQLVQPVGRTKQASRRLFLLAWAFALVGWSSEDKPELSPFDLIDRGSPQPVQDDAPYRVPNYGIVGQDAWSTIRKTEDRLRVSPAAGERRLLRMACKVGGVWRLIATDEDGDGLTINHVDSELLVAQRPDCVTQNEDLHVVYASHPFSAADSNGLLALAVMLLPFCALPFSRLLLRRFDRSVRMTLSNDHVAEAPPPVACVAPPETSIATHAIRGASGSRLFELARSARRKKLATYGLVAAASSTVIAYAWIAASGAGWTAKRQLALAVVCAWPLVPTLAGHLTSRRVVRRAVLAHAVVAASVVVWVGPSILVLLALSFAVDLGILTLFLSKTRTAHSWVVFACMLLFACANVPFFVFQEERAQRRLAELAFVVGMSSGIAALALCMLAALVAGGLLTWLVARAGASIYRRLRINSRVLSLVTFWTLYCVAQALVIGARDFGMAALALTALVPVVAALAGAVIATAARHVHPPRVLYLRCFDEGAKNAPLLSGLELWLSGVAGLDLIAGPDLASTLARPQELLDFVARRGGRTYLRTLAAFEDVRTRRGDRVDAEGGVSICDYFCANAIWKHVFRRLAADAAVVVIDARGLRPGESGTAFELTELVHHVPLERVVVVAGGSQSARARLDEVLAQAWRALPADSPNRSSAQALVQVYAHQDGADIDVLAMHVLGVIESGTFARDRSDTAFRVDVTVRAKA